MLLRCDTARICGNDLKKLFLLLLYLPAGKSKAVRLGGRKGTDVCGGLVKKMAGLFLGWPVKKDNG